VCPTVRDSRNSALLCLKVYTFRPLVLLIRVVLIWRSACSIQKITVKGDIWSTGRKICPSAILSTTNPILNGLGLKPGLRGKSPATNRLSHGTAEGFVRQFRTCTLCRYHLTVNTMRLYYKDKSVHVLQRSNR